MEIAFLTCAEYPNLTADDRLAADALVREGISVQPLVWGSDVPKTFAAVIVRSPWSYYRERGRFSDWLSAASRSGVPFWNPIDLVRWNLDKKYMLEMERAGVPIVPTLRLEGTYDQAIDRIESGEWAEIVAKPDMSAGAYRTLRLKRGEAAGKKAILSAVLKTGALLVQPYVESIETEGELSLIYFSDGRKWELSHGLRKLPKPGDFRVQKKHGGSLAADAGGQEWDELARRALAAVPHPWLYARVDMVRYEGRPVLGEMEVFEPELFFRLDPAAAGRFARCLRSRLG